MFWPAFAATTRATSGTTFRASSAGTANTMIPMYAISSAARPNHGTCGGLPPSRRRIWMMTVTATPHAVITIGTVDGRRRQVEPRDQEITDTDAHRHEHRADECARRHASLDAASTAARLADPPIRERNNRHSAGAAGNT